MHVSQVVSEILEWLESPETAISGCLSFLKDLHRLLQSWQKLLWTARAQAINACFVHSDSCKTSFRPPPPPPPFHC